jgi:hypothetical protein
LPISSGTNYISRQKLTGSPYPRGSIAV